MSGLKLQGIFVGIIAAFGVVISSGIMANAQQVVDAKVLDNAGTPRDALKGDWLSYGRSHGETRYSRLLKSTRPTSTGWVFPGPTTGCGWRQSGSHAAGLEQPSLRHHQLERRFRPGCAHG